MNYKRGKSRRKVRCAMCTPHRIGNSSESYSTPEKSKRAKSVRNRVNPDEID